MPLCRVGNSDGEGPSPRGSPELSSEEASFLEVSTRLSTGFGSKHHQESYREVSQLTHTPLPLPAEPGSHLFPFKTFHSPLLGPTPPKPDKLHKTFAENGFCDQIHQGRLQVNLPVHSWATQVIQEHRNSSQEKASRLSQHHPAQGSRAHFCHNCFLSTLQNLL